MATPPATTVTLGALTEHNPNIGNRVLPLPEYGCVYVKNNKAGCSTVTLWLHRAHTGDLEFSPVNIHLDHALPKPRDVGWPRVLGMLSGEAYRFSFVREPLGRAESAYRDKIVRQIPFRGEVQRTIGLPVDLAVVPSFEQYVSWLEAQEVETMDPHFRPQHHNLLDGLIEYDHIGHLESFDADLAIIREATGLPEVPLEVRNQSLRQPSPLDGRPDLRRRLEEFYAGDFELYGY